MIIRTPQQNKFVQSGNGDTSGNVWSSRNLDFEVNYGKVSPSERVIGYTKSDADTDYPQSAPQAFARIKSTVGGSSQDRWWTIADDSSGNTRAFQTNSATSEFDLDTNSPNFDNDSEDSDLIIFNNRIYVASGTDLYRRTAPSTTWSTISTGLDNDTHLMSVYSDRLYITNDQTVHSMNTAETIATTGSNTLDIDLAANDQLYISAMRSTSNGLWIGTYNNGGGRAKVFFWNGVTENAPTAVYKLQTAGVMALTVKDGRPYVMGMNGVLYAFNGSFFEEVARLDLDQQILDRFDVFSSNQKFIHPNGMINVRDEILMNISTKVSDNDTKDTNIMPVRSPSGVYAYNEEVGLYHKHSMGLQEDSASYFDFGQVELERAGAMWVLYEDTDRTSYDRLSDFLVGYSYKQDNSTTIAAVGANDIRGLNVPTPLKAGVLVTPEYYSSQAREMWQKLFVRQKCITDTSHKVVIKYRVCQYDPAEVDITWVNTTSFTSTDSQFATIKTNFDNNVDYEFEGLQGDGGGYLAHITALTEAGGTYTVTLDETITGATTNTAKARIDRWNKAGVIDSDSSPNDIPFINIGASSSKVQFKIYMVGDIELEEIISVSEAHALLR